MINKHLDCSEVLFSLHKNNQSVLPSRDTTLLQKQPKPKKPKKSSNKEDIIKTNKVPQYFEADNQQSKTHKQKDNTDGNPSTK